MTRIFFCTLCFRHSAFIPHTTIFASDIRQSADPLVRKMAHLHNLALNKIIAAKNIAYTELTIFSCHHLELIILKVLEHTTTVGFPTSHQFLAHSQTARCINRSKRDYTIWSFSLIVLFYPPPILQKLSKPSQPKKSAKIFSVFVRGFTFCGSTYPHKRFSVEALIDACKRSKISLLNDTKSWWCCMCNPVCCSMACNSFVIMPTKLKSFFEKTTYKNRNEQNEQKLSKYNDVHLQTELMH